MGPSSRRSTTARSSCSGAGSIVSGRLGDHWGRWIMMVIFFAGMGASALVIAPLHQQVADRRRAHPDGRLRLDLSSGRHPRCWCRRPGISVFHHRPQTDLAGNMGIAIGRRRLRLHRPTLSAGRWAFILPGVICLIWRRSLRAPWCRARKRRRPSASPKMNDLPPAVMGARCSPS